MSIARPPFQPLPASRMREVDGWAMLDRSIGYTYRPSTLEGVRSVLALARDTGHSVVPRGSGYSYGDTALNAENIVLDLTRMNTVSQWDNGSGLITVGPGVTVRDLWRFVIEDGWWPPVVPGAMYPTLGGCTAVNVHGKNNYRMGTLADHITGLELMTADGELVRVAPDTDRELYRAVVGGLGMMGIVTSIQLQMKRVQSGLLQVEEIAVPSIDHMLDLLAQRALDSDYMVGWSDGFSKGAELGRGLVQLANYVHDDPNAQQTLRAEYQDLPDTTFGIVPRSRMYLGMKPLVNDMGMRLLNGARFAAGRLRSPRVSRLPHAQFHFFHDYVPNWKAAFTPGGIVQYQVFVPADAAHTVFRSLVRRSQDADHVPYLIVTKLHRHDDQLLGYNVDGYSLSLDYRGTPSTLPAVTQMLHRFTDDIVIPAGGKFYPAKDSTITAEQVRRIWGQETVDAFLATKQHLDPDGLFQSNMYRRWFLA